jgi:gamma-glutamylcyclotransferase (GGCT)/AIG2-like uncharacterized protein YtfP
MSEKPTLKQVVVLIPGDQVMNCFCYTFSKLLLAKLEKLRAGDKIFQDGLQNAQNHERKGTVSFGTTPIANSVIIYLSQQLQITQPENLPSEIDGLIALAKEFLAIFEAEK